eukprot:CAMPEP_0181231958 /NCGR_PEP_ID=MMETSP1096-20121128/35428_1 /TAXON_ID=156174 ORGANISM="Chrysochromulina ericina, Strain CCMP281" /NCGR_SAMPLE_ID=MMETSP1096 /ASSEMBLY_ACC=CAM_ASM_000453 /LENGTH=72 /DNA_ID=CAMNT_0023326123 /DNA_START=200 /DNA_END=415 /DNA_ORIENTATION=+
MNTPREAAEAGDLYSYSKSGAWCALPFPPFDRIPLREATRTDLRSASGGGLKRVKGAVALADEAARFSVKSP